MNGPGYPQITGVKEIESLSYWRFVRLRRCLLSGAFPAAVESAAKPQPVSSKAQLIGQVYHFAMELFQQLRRENLLTAGRVRDGFFDIVAREERKACESDRARHLGELSAWPEIASLYDSIMDLTRMAAPFSSAARTPVDVHTEETLYSQDRQLFGQLDAFFVSGEGIDLIDYKSGRIEDDSGIKAEYLDQLYFYAYLIEQKFGKYPRSLALRGKEHENVEVAPDPAKSSALASEMKALLALYNRMVRAGKSVVEMATPSSDSCTWCDAKPVCPAFWGAARTLHLPPGFDAVRGVQVGEIKRARLGGASLELAVEAGTFDSSTVTVGRIFEARFPQFRSIPGQRVVVTGLRLLNSTSRAQAEITARSSLLVIGGDS